VLVSCGKTEKESRVKTRGWDNCLTDLAKAVTDKLLALMETHGSRWTQPWVSNGLHRSAISKKPYRGVNAMLTGMAGYQSPFWATYRGWAELGAQVRKGEKSTLIVFWKGLTVKDKETDEEKDILMSRFYPVFNSAQCDNAPTLEAEQRPTIERHEECERLIDASGVSITYGGDRAFYSPKVDRITLPDREQFNDAEAFYGTAFHEIGHATGHESRLNRPLIGRFGDKAYAFEELIAETTSALCCAATGISPEPRADHAQYLNNWLQALRDDKRAIFTAFSKAQAAADFILDQPRPVAPVLRPTARGERLVV